MNVFSHQNRTFIEGKEDWPHALEILAANKAADEWIKGAIFAVCKNYEEFDRPDVVTDILRGIISYDMVSNMLMAYHPGCGECDYRKWGKQVRVHWLGKGEF